MLHLLLHIGMVIHAYSSLQLCSTCNLIWIIRSAAHTAVSVHLMVIEFHSISAFGLSKLPHTHTHTYTHTHVHTQYYLSPEEKATMSRTGHERERLRPAPAEPDHYIHEHRSATSRSRVGAVSRATNERAIDSPPPISRRNLYSGR